MRPMNRLMDSPQGQAVDGCCADHPPSPDHDVEKDAVGGDPNPALFSLTATF
jgi:hypothetical protein